MHTQPCALLDAHGLTQHERPRQLASPVYAPSMGISHCTLFVFVVPRWSILHGMLPASYMAVNCLHVHPRGKHVWHIW